MVGTDLLTTLLASCATMHFKLNSSHVYAKVKLRGNHMKKIVNKFSVNKILVKLLCYTY